MKRFMLSSWTCLAALIIALGTTLEACNAAKLSIAPKEEECISTTVDLEQSQLSRRAILSIDAGLSILSASGKPNYNQRRTVDVALFAPSGQETYNNPGVWKDIKFSIQAPEVGTYKLCITASGRLRSDTVVVIDFFTISHDDTASNDGLPPPGQAAETRPDLASHLHLTQVHDLVSRIKAQLERVSGEQRHFRSRLRRHLRTNMTMHGRAFMYFAIEAGVVFMLAAVQVTTVHVMFRNRRGNQGVLGA